MTSAWLTPLAFTLAVVAGLELVALLLRREFPRFFERLRLQLWVITVGLVALFSFARGHTLLPFGLDGSVLAGAGFLAVILTLDLAYRVVDRFVLSRRLDVGGRPAIPQLVRDLGAWVAVFAAFVLGGYWFLGFDLSAFALSSAAATAALGFALQDVLKNVFAGIALQTEQPFDLGDWLEVDGSARQVIQMSWRSTQMRDNLGVEYREPNANLVAARITRLGSGAVPVGFAVHVGVTYGSPPGRVKQSLERAAREAEGVIAQPPPQALVVGFGESAVQYELRYWSDRPQNVARVRDHVLTRVWYQLHRDGWTIPFPIRTVQIESQRRIAADKAEWRAARADGLIASTDLFAGLDPAARRRLAAGARQLYFDTGEQLVVEGESGDSLMLLSRGAVTVSKRAVHGTAPVQLAELGAGSYFGEMSLLTGAPRSATVTADGPVEVFVLDREALAPILESDPAIAETLSRRLTERTAATDARLEEKREIARVAGDSDQMSLLRRIRGFFKLGGRNSS
jgi:small-conductance mechanosensitive channel/CRP-like cAMP-binding protein